MSTTSIASLFRAVAEAIHEAAIYSRYLDDVCIYHICICAKHCLVTSRMSYFDRHQIV